MKAHQVSDTGCLTALGDAVFFSQLIHGQKGVVSK